MDFSNRDSIVLVTVYCHRPAAGKSDQFDLETTNVHSYEQAAQYAVRQPGALFFFFSTLPVDRSNLERIGFGEPVNSPIHHMGNLVTAKGIRDAMGEDLAPAGASFLEKAAAEGTDHFVFYRNAEIINHLKTGEYLIDASGDIYAELKESGIFYHKPQRPRDLLIRKKGNVAFINFTDPGKGPKA